MLMRRNERLRIKTRSGMNEMRSARAEQASPGTNAYMFGVSKSGERGFPKDARPREGERREGLAKDEESEEGEQPEREVNEAGVKEVLAGGAPVRDGVDADAEGAH